MCFHGWRRRPSELLLQGILCSVALGVLEPHPRPFFLNHSIIDYHHICLKPRQGREKPRTLSSPRPFPPPLALSYRPPRPRALRRLRPPRNDYDELALFNFRKRFNLFGLSC